VAAESRGRGYAHRLIQRCLEEAVSRGFQASLLHTHIPLLYERNGYRVLPTVDVILEGTASKGWFVAEALTASDWQLYCRDHGRRPGTMVRDQRYWEARERWLVPEGWHIFQHTDAVGYCMAWYAGDVHRLDESAGDCTALLREGGPRISPSARWRWRLPREQVADLPLAPPNGSVAMVRPLVDDIDLGPLASPAAVLWMTDAF
jgi:hypothetical protein